MRNQYQNQNQYNRIRIDNRNRNENPYMANPGNNKTTQQKGKLEYLTSAISIQIIEYTEKHIDNSPVIFYRIKITDHFNNMSWDVPKLPGKTFFRVSDYQDIKKRKDGLQSFLKLVLKGKISLQMRILNYF